MRPAPSRTLATGPVAAAVLLALTGSLAGAPALADADLVVHLSPGSAPGHVVFGLANEGDVPVSVLRTDTPLDTTLAEDAFDLHRPSKAWDVPEAATYTGRLYKRVPPSAADFVRIGPGETVSSTVPLERYYDVPEAGDYTVRFDGAFRTRTDTSPVPRTRGAAPLPAPAADLVEIVPATVPGTDRITVELRPGEFATRARPPAFNGCGPDQQRDIVEAIAAAETLAAESLRSLTDLPVSQRATAPRYVRWFGRYTANRYATVTQRFDAILGALAGETLGTDCTCDEDGIYAYVFANRPYDVYLCPVFFRADTLGTDSRAGTFVHELSHFQVLGGTQDHVYSQRPAAGLALDDPDRAVENADSIEYFAENTPALAMINDGGPVELPDDGPPAPRPPSGSGQFADLPPGTRVGGSLAEGGVAVFRADGADSISLTSLSGDADLYVFDDPALDEPVCVAAAFSADSTLDLCELPSGDTWYVAVRGFTDTDYEILATALDLGGTSPGNGPFAGIGGGVVDDPVGGTGGGSAGGGVAGWSWLGLLGGVAARRRRQRGRPVPGTSPHGSKRA